MNNKVLSDLRKIVMLIFDLVFLCHPITLDIRYRFHVVLGKLYSRDVWTREDWEPTVCNCNNYTPSSFFTALIKTHSFRKNIIKVLTYEKERILGNPIQPDLSYTVTSGKFEIRDIK